MPIVIKELNIKVNVEDKQKVVSNAGEATISEELLAKIVEKCTKKVLSELKQSTKR